MTFFLSQNINRAVLLITDLFSGSKSKGSQQNEEIKNLNIIKDQKSENLAQETNVKMGTLQKMFLKLCMLLNFILTQLNGQKKKAKEMNDPKHYKKAKQSIFNSFLDNIKTFEFTQAIDKAPGRKYHMVMGLISAGKSSLLMKITGVKLNVGHGQTTDKPARIGQFQHADKTVEVYDSPGINQEFSCYDITTLALLYAMDDIFVVQRDSLKNVADLLKTINAIKPQRRINLIRTHCDTFSQDDFRTCDEEIAVDYNYMKGLGIPCNIFAFSSKRDMKFKDNQKVAKLIRVKSRIRKERRINDFI